LLLYDLPQNNIKRVQV